MRVLLCLTILAGPVVPVKAWAEQTGAEMAGIAGARPFFLADVMREAAARGVPPELADAVAMVETGYRPGAVGSSGEVGIMQILPATAAALGFHGEPGELFEPSINIPLAVEYLSRAWAVSEGNICRALMKYRAGLGQEVMTPLSAQYCARAMGWLFGTGSRLPIAGPPLPSVAPPAGVDDPHVVAMGPAGAGNVQLGRVAEPPVSLRPRRSMAQRAAALQARFDSHQRRYGNAVSSDNDRDHWQATGD